jgi:predicted DNA binding CopG/RHH family protein
MKSTGKIENGKKDVLDQDEFSSKHAKFRVTMYVDLPVLESIREEAKEKGLPYQTYINQLLREHVSGDGEKRMREIAREEFKKLGK